MRKYIIVLLALVMIQSLSYATPIIDNISVNPKSIWIGSSPTVTFNCYDDGNKSVTAYANTIGPNIFMPLTPDINRLQNGTFIGNYGTLETSYLDKVWEYEIELLCNNSGGITTSNSTTFSISKLTGYISYLDSEAYIGDDLEIDFNVKKNDTVLSWSDNVNFEVKLNDITYPLKINPPLYYMTKGWILKVGSPSYEGVYNLKVYAYYDNASVYNSTSINVRKRINFGVVGLSNNWLEGNENITVSLRALDKGSIIDVNKNNLRINIASANLNILSIDRNGNNYDVRVTTPTVSAGTYNVEAILDYDGSSYSDSKPIDYIVSVDGRIADENGKGINAQMSFYSASIEKLKISTDSSGYYSGSIPPAIYDVKITFPQSALLLKGASVNNFNDPIKYFYSSDQIVPGIRSAGVFGYEVALTYSEAGIEMRYDERNVLDENNLIILKCSSWNSGRKICSVKWSEINGDIDTVRNMAKVNMTSLSAFVVGERQKIDASFNLDNKEYYIGSKIEIRGIVKDSDGNAVVNSTIKAQIRGTEQKSIIQSDNNGVFTLEFDTPNFEGGYYMDLTAEKSPYISFSASKSFDIKRSRAIEINVPETIKLKQGQKLNQEISIINSGQADLTNLNISLTGIPKNYYNITSFIEVLKQNEEGKISIIFDIPSDAAKQTYSASIEVSNSYIKQEKIIGLTIIDGNDTANAASSAPSGKFILPGLDNNMIYVSAFAVACFSIAIILKKIKVKRSKRYDIEKSLFDIKDYFRKGRPNNMAAVRGVSQYKDLILSEFPNALKDDDYGKDN
ncbi:MAG: hypothetical protein V1678_00660 [Candidatus Aenigmatarchaeota archaeon]